MFKELLNNINNKYNTIKEENNQYKELLNTTTTFNNLSPLPSQSNKQISEHIIHYITETSPDINQKKANIIANLIPIKETYLSVYYAKEILTNKELYIVPTNQRLWIINQSEYITYPLEGNQISIIKNNIMSKSIIFNNILLEINGNNEKINNLINILTNQIERQNTIIGIASHLGEPNESGEVTNLELIPLDKIDAFSTIFIGNQDTHLTMTKKMVTPLTKNQT